MRLLPLVCGRLPFSRRAHPSSPPPILSGTPLLRSLRPRVRGGPGGHVAEVPGGPDEPGWGLPGAGRWEQRRHHRQGHLWICQSPPHAVFVPTSGGAVEGRGARLSPEEHPEPSVCQAPTEPQDAEAKTGRHPPAHTPAASPWLAGRVQRLPKVAPTQGLPRGAQLCCPSAGQLPPGVPPSSTRFWRVSRQPGCLARLSRQTLQVAPGAENPAPPGDEPTCWTAVPSPAPSWEGRPDVQRGGARVTSNSSEKVEEDNKLFPTYEPDAI